MVTKAASAWFLGSLATNNASAWQQWQPSQTTTHGNPSNNHFELRPSFMYLDNYDPNSYEYNSSSEYKSSSDDLSADSTGKGIKAGRGRSKTKQLAPKLNKNLSFHNYPSHIADTNRLQDERRPRKRGKLVARTSYGSAILPCKRTKSKSNLLSFDEETDIAHAIQAYATAMRIKDDLCNWMSKERSSRISGLNKVPSDEHWAAACSLTVSELHDVVHRGQEARSRLVNGNVGLVTMIAKKYHNILTQKVGVSGGTLKLDDLIQEGYCGLLDAAERFSPEKGFRFSTYGSYWVRQRILRSISETARIIRVPEHVQAMMRNIEKKRREFEELAGRTPSLPELAYELSISLEKITLYQHLTRNVMSLEHQLNEHSTKDDKQLTVGDRLACNEIPTPDEDAMSEAFRGEVHSMLDHLCDNERWVLTHRFGLEDGYPRTLHEISEEMCVPIDIVKNLETEALKKLRQPRMMYRLKDFVDEGADEGRWDVNGYYYNGNVYHEMSHDGIPSGLPLEGHEYVDHHHSMINHMNHQMLYNNYNGVQSDDLDDNERPTPESIWSF